MLVVTIEWVATFLALAGSYMMSTKKYNPSLTWIFWILSNILFAYFFFYKEQFGLTFYQFFGVFTNIIGLYQWKFETDKSSNQSLYTFKIIRKYSYVLSAIFLGLSVMLFLTLFMYNQKLFPMYSMLNSWQDNHKSIEISLFEWFCGFMNLSAAFLLASKHKTVNYCWPIWLISNCCLLYIGFINQQYGVMFLNSMFTLINLNACYYWIIQDKLNHKKMLSDPSMLSEH